MKQAQTLLEEVDALRARAASSYFLKAETESERMTLRQAVMALNDLAHWLEIVTLDAGPAGDW
jgi:hypothetical protein